MKRLLAFCIVLLLFPLSACSAGLWPSPSQASAQGFTATPASSATPEIPRVIVVFGAEDAEAFLTGLRDAAKDSGITIEAVKGGVSALGSYEPEGDTIAIVYLAAEERTLPQVGFPVYAFAANGQSVSGIPYLGYDGSGAARVALDDALAYPPHLAPVRMIGLFTSETSSAYALWTEQKAAAQVFAKEEYFASSAELSLSDWLNEAFTRYVPGMLDAVFAETGELAVAAADTLASLERDDIEVFSAGIDHQAAEKLSPILVCAVGMNRYDAGAQCFAEASKQFSGEQAKSGILLPESFGFEKKN